MSGHTKEPWVVHSEKRAIVPFADSGKTIPLAGDAALDPAHTIALFRDPDATMSEYETYANAFRLCQCVNALANIPDPAAYVAAFERMCRAARNVSEEIGDKIGCDGWCEDPLHGETLLELNAALSAARAAMGEGQSDD